MLASYTFSEHVFLDIIRLLDKVQSKVKTHLMDSEAVKKALYLYSAAENYGKEVYVEAWSAFSVSGYIFKSHCTNLILTQRGGTVRRIVAPERPYGRGNNFEVHVLDPSVAGLYLLKLFPSLQEVAITAEGNHLIFSGK